jgi:putative addiction module component (TIGR02574 family)
LSLEIIMTTTLEALEAEVLKLPPADRSRLLERIIASLDVDQEVEAAWDAVADKREAEIESGEVRPVPLEEALARLEARFAG